MCVYTLKRIGSPLFNVLSLFSNIGVGEYLIPESYTYCTTAILGQCMGNVLALAESGGYVVPVSENLVDARLLDSVIPGMRSFLRPK